MAGNGNGDIWMTPSRYARKLRRHLETKVRGFARMLVDLRQQFPDTLVSASGDAEMELNFGGLDMTKPFEEQEIADYSPFAIAEFRDWIRNAGLYGPGQPYDGQGLAGGRARYGGPDGLQNFWTDYGKQFTSWNLLYFDWDVMSDPVDGDPKAIPAAVYEGTGWTPLPPPTEPIVTPGPFDAPRFAPATGTDPRFWKLWLQFRETMVANYQKDFAAWMTTTADASGNTFETQRWYSHQIPADYLDGTCPGCANPHPRLRTSAGPMWTADVRPSGSLGLTAFDVYTYDPVSGQAVYNSTSKNLLPALKAQGIPNWGLVEWSPSWPLGAPDPDVAGIAANARRAYDAGAHILNHPWLPFVGTPENPPTNPGALDLFLSQVKNQPRDAGTVAYAPTQVTGLSGRWISSTIPSTISLSWSDLVFPGVAGFRYVDWPVFTYFEVWRGPSRAFGTADVKLVGKETRTSSLAGIPPDASRPFYRVRAVARSGAAGALAAGAFSNAVWLPPQGGTTFFALAPCRPFDTRGINQPPSPIAALETRIVTLTDACGIPVLARAVSANVTVAETTAPGSLAIVAGDAAGPTTTSTVTFGVNQNRGNNAMLLLAGDGSGTVRLENLSAGTLHVILDVNGYFK
jgi:hypothetical protein